MGRIDEQGEARWHGDNGAWVYAQCCAQGGRVVDADVVCQVYDEFGDEGCGDWLWLDIETATTALAEFSDKKATGPNAMFLLRAANNVIEYVEGV